MVPKWLPSGHQEVTKCLQSNFHVVTRVRELSECLTNCFFGIHHRAVFGLNTSVRKAFEYYFKVSPWKLFAMGVKPPALFFTDYVLPKTEWIKNGLTQTLKRDKKSVLDKKMFSKESQGIGSYKKHLRRALPKVHLDEAVYGIHC